MTETLSPADAHIRALIEQNEAIQELTKHRGWQEFANLAAVAIDAYQVRLNTGKLSIDDYRFVAGFLDGARQLLDIPRVVEERLRRTIDAQDQSADDDYADFGPAT